MRIFMFVMIVLLCQGRECIAQTIEYEDFDSWAVDVGEFTTIDFTGYEAGTHITDQYAHLGATFTTLDQIVGPNLNVFPNDGWGLSGFFDEEIIIEFDEPIFSIAADYPSELWFQLFLGEEMIYQYFPLGGLNVFNGLLSDTPFDRVRLFNNISPFIDNLYFGPPIPAPSALGLLACAGFVRCRRRS